MPAVVTIDTTEGKVVWTDHALKRLRQRASSQALEADLPNPIAMIRAAKFFRGEVCQFKLHGELAARIRWVESSRSVVVITVAPRRQRISNKNIAQSRPQRMQNRREQSRRQSTIDDDDTPGDPAVAKGGE